MDSTARALRHQGIIAERRLALQIQLDQILPGPEELVLEIGCGHGHFLTAYASVHKDTLCLGIDIATERIDRALRKRQRSRLPNLHFVQAEARLFLETLPAHAQLARTFILFPDPWPKLRHQKHRLLQPDFLLALARRSSPTARLHFRTDFEPYFAEVSAALGQANGWVRVDEEWPFDFETVFQSRAKAFSSLTARPNPARLISPPPLP